MISVCSPVGAMAGNFIPTRPGHEGTKSLAEPLKKQQDPVRLVGVLSL